MFSKLAFVSALAALLSGASAHMVIVSPNPYSPGSLTNSPLDASGSDYPCKLRSDTYGPPKAPNNMPVGAQQTLAFKGSAVHGGGSCQISLTSDKTPSKSSAFKVVHSIVGGCPSNASAGNLPENPDGSSANKYFFSIPNDVPNGDYALAWTWFNKIGNREMYMNCAPVTVSGSTGSTDTFNALPDMFIANVGTPTCTTVDSKDVAFPQAGKSVENDGTAGAPVPPTCPGNNKDGTTAPGGTAPPAPAPAPAAGAPAAGGGSAAPSATPAAASPSAAPASSSGVIGPAASMSPAAPAAASPSAVYTPPAVAASPASGGASTPAAAAPAGSVPCSNPGQVVCIGQGQFGICDTNNAAVPQPLAQGTSCQNGKIARRHASGGSPSLRARGHGNAHVHVHEHVGKTMV